MNQDAPPYIDLDTSANELKLESDSQSDISLSPIFVTISASLENYETVLPAQI